MEIFCRGSHNCRVDFAGVGRKLGYQMVDTAPIRGVGVVR